jgi:uncharacterized membrane protein YdjX (TVP38/TMEM64 family)
MKTATHTLRNTSLTDASLPRWTLVVGAALLLLVAALAVWFAWDREAVRAWKENASPLAFFSAMAILPAFGVPLTPFYIVAGATFGLRSGLLASAIALTVNLILSYVVARRALRNWLQRLLQRFDYKFPDFEREQGALRFALLVKLTPGVPMVLKNYLLGMSGVPFGTYLAVSLFTAALYAVPLMALGNSLFQHDSRRAWVAAVLIAVAVAIAWFWRRHNSQSSQDT